MCECVLLSLPTECKIKWWWLYNKAGTRKTIKNDHNNVSVCVCDQSVGTQTHKHCVHCQTCFFSLSLFSFHFVSFQSFPTDHITTPLCLWRFLTHSNGVHCLQYNVCSVQRCKKQKQEIMWSTEMEMERENNLYGDRWTFHTSNIMI